MRTCHNCIHGELCFIRNRVSQLVYVGQGILYDAGKDKKGELKEHFDLPGDTEGIFVAVAECCMKYERMQENV